MQPGWGGAGFRPTIRVTVVGIFILATVLTALLAVGLQYKFTRQMASEAAVSRFNGLADGAGEFLNAMDSQAAQTARLLASYPGLVQERQQGPWASPQVRELFAELLRNNPMLYAIYLGFDNGDFYELINLNSGPVVRRQLQAAPSDRWVVIAIRGEGEERRRTFEFYDADFRLRTSRSEVSDYNATGRPWFVQAVAGEVRKTAPYLFTNLQAPGQTYSTRTREDNGVIAVDIALGSVSAYLSSHRLSDVGSIYLYRRNGELIASNQVGGRHVTIPPAQPLTLTEAERKQVADRGALRVSNEIDWAPIDFAISGQPQGYSIDFLSLIARMTGLRFEYINGFSWPELVDLYQRGDIDVLQPVFDDGSGRYEGHFSDSFLSLPYSVVTRPGQPPITALQQLEGLTVAVPRGWSITEVLRREMPAIQLETVDSSRGVFEAVESGRADAGMDVGEILHYLAQQFFYQHLQFHNDIDFAPLEFTPQLRLLLSEEHAALVPLLNRAIAAVSDEQRQALARKWFDGETPQRDLMTVPHRELLTLAARPDQQRQLLQRQIDGELQFVFVMPFSSGRNDDDYLALVVPVADVLQPALQQVRWSVLMTLAFLLLLAPLPWLFASPIVGPIRKLAEENEKIRQRRFDELDIPASYIREVDELGVSMSNMAAAIREHELNQQRLMDAFIQVIAQAIDDKSPYTAGHCERVPRLAMMLVEKAHASQAPAFRDFAFRDDAEWREFRIGAWLHDCGKITTPEHIIDKGSKLEVIYNRIHEVRTRFDVLWRDAEIHYWQQLQAAPQAQPRLQAELAAAHQQLQEDFAFVAAMNQGGEQLSEERKLRLQQIARRRWQRHFSDRLGLSPREEMRLQGPEPSLPCEEALLQDRPEHIIPRTQSTDYDPRLGINMTVPEQLYNQGEVYNLLIERGTLTREDRFKINEHIISTIRMLDALPLPPELARVPRYASTHHESLLGDGYPRGLTAKDLSLPERIMVLADIFEALTAADRPYKKAKPVSVALGILRGMVEAGHVDADVFELFITSGVCQAYANRFLAPEQLDEPDLLAWLRRPH